MGILYSTYSYFASWFPGQKIVLTEAKITVSANRLIHHLKLREVELQKKTLIKEKELLSMIVGNPMTRNIGAEKTIISEIIMDSYLLSGYEELIVCASIIKSQAKAMEANGKLSEKCIIAICTILYCYEPLHLSECFKMDDLIPKPHPTIKVEQISDPFREYVEYKKVSEFCMNVYVLEMCYRNKISLEKVNEVGHKFAYNPSKMQQKMEERESRSSMMFALSVELDQEDFAV